MPKKKGTSWVKKADIYSDMTDDGFVAHWKPIIESIAKVMLNSYRLPDSCYDDFLSDGMTALARIPRESRWNANYVQTAIRNKLITQLKSAKTRWGRLEYWGEIPEDSAVCPDTTVNRLTLQACTIILTGIALQVVTLYLRGYSDKDVAVILSITPQEVKATMGTAVSDMQSHVAKSRAL
jgi:DNA-directed RNA polymerase specialized sigma24 family protein